MSLSTKLFSLFFGVLFLVGGVCVWSLQTSVETISINGTELTVRVADRVLAQKKGLAGYTQESLVQDGMLFVFSDSRVRTFWMKGMRMDLDIVWISQGKIVAIDRNVPAPFSRADEPETVTSQPLFVDMVLELPAGASDTFGLLEGMQLTFPE